MPKQSQFEIHALSMAKAAENRAKKFDESSLKCRLEARAYYEAIDWYKRTNGGRKNAKTNKDA